MVGGLVAMSLFSIGCEAMANESNVLIYGARSKDDIIKWAREKYHFGTGFGIVYNDILLDVNGKEFLVLLADSASGVRKVVIHLYAYSEESKTWELLLIRWTNTSEVKVAVKENNVMFWSKENELLFMQPAGSAAQNSDFIPK